MSIEAAEEVGIDTIFNKLHQHHPSFILELPHGVSLEKRYDLVTMKRERVKPISFFEVETHFPWPNLCRRNQERSGDRGNRQE